MAAKAKVEEQEIRNKVIDLTANLLDRVRYLEYGVGQLNPIKPFE